MKTEFSKTFIVKENETAQQIGSGGLPVLSTPSMITYMENTAWEAVEDLLDDKSSTVGMEINVKHNAPIAVGKEVKVVARLIERTEKLFIFQMKAYADQKTIGEADHKRVTINKDDFLSRV